MADFKGFAALGHLLQQAAMVHEEPKNFGKAALGYGVSHRTVGSRAAVASSLDAAGQTLVDYFRERILTHGDGQWEELRESTIDQRELWGFTPDDQLFRTTQMINAIGYEKTGRPSIGVLGLNIGVINPDDTYDPGLNSNGNVPKSRFVDPPTIGQLFDWHAYGTSRMPARPIFNTPEAEDMIQDIAMMVGEQWIEQRLLRRLRTVR